MAIEKYYLMEKKWMDYLYNGQIKLFLRKKIIRIFGEYNEYFPK